MAALALVRYSIVSNRPEALQARHRAAAAADAQRMHDENLRNAGATPPSGPRPINVDSIVEASR